jgi:hypothetical protein
MDKEILILGGLSIDEDKKIIIDSYENICRININMKYKNPQKRNIFYLNNHVYENFLTNKLPLEQLYRTYKFTELNYIKEFYNMIQNKEYSKILCQYELGTNISNRILKNLKCPYMFNKQPRCGYQAILYFLKEGFTINIMGFSVDENDTRKSYYCALNKPNSCHDWKQEIKILNWLINNKFIKNVF